MTASWLTVKEAALLIGSVFKIIPMPGRKGWYILNNVKFFTNYITIVWKVVLINYNLNAYTIIINQIPKNTLADLVV